MQERIHPLLIGITGCIGSGKSLASNYLQQQGFLVLNADHLGHQVLVADHPAFQTIVARFGTTILNPDHTINRKALGTLVFQSPESLSDLNRIVHPFMSLILYQNRVNFFKRNQLMQETASHQQRLQEQILFLSLPGLRRFEPWLCPREMQRLRPRISFGFLLQTSPFLPVMPSEARRGIR